MKADAIIARIRTALPDAIVELSDLTGTEDHWKATIVSAGFTGRTMLERHRIVMAALVEEMKGPIHALTLDVRSPEESEK